MKIIGLLTSAVLTLALTGPVRADYPADAPVKPFNLPDLAGLTSVSFDLQYTSAHTEFFDAPTLVKTDYTILTFDLAVDIEFAPQWVALIELPFAYLGLEVEPEAFDPDCCGFALGALTLGARWLQADVGDAGLRTVLGAEFSLSLPTASNDGDGASTAVFAGVARLSHDPTLYVPDYLTPKLLGHGQIYAQYFLLQGELGFYLPIYTGDNDDDGDTAELLLRAAVAAGVRATREISFVLELNNLVPLTGDDDDEESATSVDLGLRYGSRGFVAGLRFMLPIDDARADGLDMWGVGADISARF